MRAYVNFIPVETSSTKRGPNTQILYSTMERVVSSRLRVGVRCTYILHIERERVRVVRVRVLVYVGADTSGRRTCRCTGKCICTRMRTLMCMYDVCHVYDMNCTYDVYVYDWYTAVSVV